MLKSHNKEGNRFQVFVEEGDPPQVIHNSYKAAEHEAVRLAKLVPYTKVWVLKVKRCLSWEE